jgi:Holliday junction DNA helicase RuvA
MIALLRGRVADVSDDSAVIDVGGVGYLVHASVRTLAELRAQRELVELHVDTQVREDAITLFGFLEPAERVWFRLLQGIQGVGARTALAVVGTIGPSQLVAAIAAQDRTALTRVSGVGPKLAARIVAELKDRVGALPSRVATPFPATASPAPSTMLEEAVSALVNLGYGRSEAFAAAASCQPRLGDRVEVGALIREALRELSR